MEKGKVLLVDLNDNPIKKTDKISAHKTPKLHRAFSVFIVNNGKMLIQKRAKTKYHSPSLWANACCSHPLTDDVLTEANLRAKTELGISENLELEPLFKFIYFAKVENLFEFELDHVLLSTYDGKIKLNKDEAEKYLWVDFDKLEKQMMKNPKKFAPWFLICAPKVINILKNR